MSENNFLDLRVQGKSLREIASTLGISHTTVMRKIRGMENKNVKGDVTGNFTDETKCNIPIKSHKSRFCGSSKDTGNQVVTKKTPSLTIGAGVTSSKTPKKEAHRCQKGVSRKVFSGGDGLMGAIKEFFESKGIEIYRMRTEMEAYQVESNGEVIRFYAQRKQGKD